MMELETKCLHAGYEPQNGEPRQIPIVQSTTFKYDTSEDMGKLFDLEASGYFYTRLQNPTNDAVAAKIAALEGGTAAMLTSSGQAANFYAVFNICSCGDHVVACSTIYGGTFNLFSVTMKRMGIEFTFVEPDCSDEELEAAFRPNTKAVFGETIANPALTILDIEKFAKAAHAHGVPLIMDNTFATPVNCRPFEWGCDIVTHSTTKYMDGHALTVGGAIVDSGKFDWNAHADKFPGLTTPDESYHGVTYTERFGLGGAYITKATVQLMRDLGSIPSPHNCFLLNVGLETLPLRMKKHCENAQAVAEYLQGHEKIAWVEYAGLPGDKYYERAKKYLPNGTCGVVVFGVKGGRAAAEKFMAGLKLASIATHVADAKTCVLHPASSTHRQMNDEELDKKLEHISVYARVSPEHKIRIVDAWQKKGKIVSMTGDGVNDAPALKKADIGVAMGITGTEVSKDAASMILTDDNFATIVKAVTNGRNVYANIKNAIKFLLSGNMSAILSVLYTSLFGLAVPFQPVHLLFINLLTDSLPAIAIGMEPAREDLLNQKPRNPKESIMTKDFMLTLLVQGALIGVFVMTAYHIGLSEGGAALASTMAFATLTLARLFHGFNCRADASIFKLGLRSNIYSILAFVAGLVLLNAVLFIPAFHGLFLVADLTLIDIGWIYLLAFIPTVLIQIYKVIKERVK